MNNLVRRPTLRELLHEVRVVTNAPAWKQKGKKKAENIKTSIMFCKSLWKTWALGTRAIFNKQETGSKNAV